MINIKSLDVELEQSPPGARRRVDDKLTIFGDTDDVNLREQFNEAIQDKLFVLEKTYDVRSIRRDYELIKSQIDND